MRQREDQLIELAENCLKNGAELVFFPEAFQHANNRAIKQNPEELLKATDE